MTKRRIVITGMGVVSPIGIGKELFWQNLFAGKPAFKPITLFDTSELKVKVGGEITEFNPKEILGKRGLVDLDRATTLLLSAVKFALEDAHLDITEENTHTTGISVGTTFGSLNSLSEFDRQSLEEGPHFVNPSRFPNTVINSPASRTAIRYGIKGPNATVSTGFCASLDALEYAAYLLNNHKAERILVGVVEEMCFQTFFGFYKLGYLSGLDGTPPLSCPFDKRRNGIIFSEGSVVFVVEHLEIAQQRKAPIYSEILGFGSGFDPYRLHKVNPKGAGIVQSMRSALSNANVGPDKIDCIFANANSTQDVDLVETNSIKSIFAPRAKQVPVSAIKSILGESYSAGGAFAISAAIGAIQKGSIPPTINLENKDPQCDLDYVPKYAKKQQINKALLNTFGPNGASSSLVIGKV